ncbi:MAG: AAA family ATPase [Ignavibacteria bacterium]|nr:AAA family ATPase [Ignavibacteria bacterium]
MLRTQQQVLTNEELDEKLKDAFDHLTEGRYRIALTNAQKVFEFRPNDFRVAICLAWAYLENNEPDLALEYADLAVKLGKEMPTTKLYRGFILMRMGIFDGAIADLDVVIKTKTEPLSWAHHLKAKALAGQEKYADALEEFELAIRADRGATKIFPRLREWYRNAAGQSGSFLTKLVNKKTYVEEAEDAYKSKEYWYSLWAIKRSLQEEITTEQKNRMLILELESMYALFQLKPALEKAKKVYESLKDDQRFQQIYNKLQNTEKKNRQESAPKQGSLLNILGEDIPAIEETTSSHFKKTSINLGQLESPKSTKHSMYQSLDEQLGEEILKQPEKPVQQDKKVIILTKRTDFQRFDNTWGIGYFARTFDVNEEIRGNQREYYLQFAEGLTGYIGIEAIISNPYYQLKDEMLSGTAIWKVNGNEVGRNDFSVQSDSNWKQVIMVQSWGTEQPGFWKRGQGCVEIYFNNQKICERWFLIGQSSIPNTEEIDIDQLESELSKRQPAATLPQKSVETVPTAASSIDELFKELNAFTGLSSVKQSMREFVDYLQFIKERQKLGLKTQDTMSFNCVFQGNPGTGKTSVARVLGGIFKSMGILEKGHLVEVDRSSLVGQYIGETAQKTDKVIEEAMGGLLFIDEAYTLVKKGGSGQDFGQEAIDTLLKRMEDKAGQFAIIVAGYPNEMEDFLSSNPGMKSRFNHFFTFEDYNPDELISIFKGIAAKEDFSIETPATDLLLKEFTSIYRKRDKTFGNARFVRNLFNDAKMKLSKRYLKLPESMRDKQALTTFTAEDFSELFVQSRGDSYKVGVDRESLNRALEELNSLTGLHSVKKDIDQMVKLVNYYIDMGENIENKFTDHILFLGNPGTGKTTVARLVSQIFAALGIIPKGHLVEADRQLLVAPFVGKTAEKTTELVNTSMGGTLFIDEAYTLVKQGDSSDFGKEAIDTLLKRMEDDRGKFIVIAAGYTEEMQKFIESNPGLQSRFTKTFMFEDYAPDEMIAITKVVLRKKKMQLDTEAEDALRKYYMELYRNRDKNFGNARLVRNVCESAVRNHMLRMVDIPKDERTDDHTKFLRLPDLQEIVNVQTEKKIIHIEGDKEKLDLLLKELNELTGLDSVKKSVDKLISGLKVAKIREARGLKVIKKNLHSVFLGNPGTGKTTVARLLSRIYKEMGLLEKGHLVEVDRSALVAGYQGQTAVKTDEVIAKALGGTLFIDEAYTLTRGGDAFGQEAIDTILKRMEDYKDELVIIVAGYPEEMQTFLDANPGMQSRFTNFFMFEDYTPRQMLEIATMIGEKNGYHLDEGALQMLLDKFTRLYASRDANFGNARTVRNLLYKAISNQEERILTVLNPTDEDLTMITFEDVQAAD